MESQRRSLIRTTLGVVLVVGARSGFAEPAPGDAAKPAVEATDRTTGSPGAAQVNAAQPSTAQPNAAQPNATQAAQDLFWEATREYHDGNYGRAAELFEQLYVLVPESEVVFNIALASAKSGHCERAKARFAEYTAQVSDGAVRERATAKFSEVIETCRESQAEVISDRPAPANGAGHEVPARAAEVSQSDSSPTEASPPVAHDAAGTSQQQIWGWALVGAAAAATGTGIYFETQRQDARSNAEHAVTSHDYEEFRADYDHARVLEMVSFGAAVGLTGLGITLLVLDTPVDASLAFALGTDRAGQAPFSGSVRLTGSF